MSATNTMLLKTNLKQLRLPAIYIFRDQAEAGGLMSYSWDIKSAIRRNAIQIAEILHGAKPADMPYFQETSFELVINLKTAKELGLEIPDRGKAIEWGPTITLRKGACYWINPLLRATNE